VAGHRLVPVWAPFKTVGDTQDQHPGLCQQLTVDNKVFAVLSVLGMDPEFDSCFSKAHLPLLDDAAGLTQGYLNGMTLVTPGAPLGEREYRDEIADMIHRGALTKSTKIGVLWLGEPKSNQLVSGTVLPTLKADGLQITSTFAATNDSNQIASYGNAVLQFETKGVDMVISVGTSPLFFMNDAESQHYFPHYVLNSDYGPGALLELAAPKDQLANSVGVGWQPYSDVDAGHNPGPVTPNETRCLKIMAGAGLSSSSTLTILLQLQTCDAFFVLAAALNHAAQVTVPAMVNGTLALGQSFLATDTFRTSFGNRLDGVAAARDFSYFSSCSCFQYDRPLAPFK
jgi:hypothetical protein